MAAIAPISITDSTSTTIVFDPAKINDDFALWEDRTAPVYIGYSKLSMQYRRPTGVTTSGTSRYCKPVVKIDIPEIAQNPDTGLYELVGRDFATVEMSLRTTATTAQKQKLLDILKGALASSTVSNLVVNNEFVW
jgi:hypothetical protein